MVMRSNICAAFLIVFATQPSLAKSPQELMFPRSDSCYARKYGAIHLANHPDQRITRFAVSPDYFSDPPNLALELRLDMRGDGGGALRAYATCENEGADTLYCAMEGDAGGFQVTPAKNGSILVSVSSLGMTFETATGFVTLERSKGDDSSFILRPVPCR